MLNVLTIESIRQNKILKGENFKETSIKIGLIILCFVMTFKKRLLNALNKNELSMEHAIMKLKHFVINKEHFWIVFSSDE